MAQNITVVTSSGKKYYKIEKYEGKNHIYKFKSAGFFSDDYDKLGSTSSMEDAISLIRSDASQYGSISSVDIG
jgi:hypothetical protein